MSGSKNAQEGIYFVMEFIEGDNLHDVLGQVCSRGKLVDSHREYYALRRLFRQIVYAVAYIHIKGIVHQDLKPENCMVYSDGDYSCIKLIDFGLSVDHSGEVLFNYEWSEHRSEEPIIQRLSEERELTGLTEEAWQRRLIITNRYGGHIPLQWENGKLTTDFSGLQELFPVTVTLANNAQEQSMDIMKRPGTAGYWAAEVFTDCSASFRLRRLMTSGHLA